MNIILSGPGRSGTTLFSKIFSHHKDFAWISGWVNKYPNLTSLSKFNNIYQNQWLGINWAEVRFSPKPAEAYNYWNYFFKPFTSNNIYLDQDKIIEARLNIQKIKTSSNKAHFVTKITGDTRYQILNEVFQGDLKYLWIERDPRVVVSSYIKQKWGYKNKPDKFDKMDMAKKIEINTDRYLNYFHQSRQIEKNLIFYEDMCANPLSFFRDLFQEISVNLSSQQEEIIKNWLIKPITWDNHYKFKYKDSESELLHELLYESLSTYNYI